MLTGSLSPGASFGVTVTTTPTAIVCGSLAFVAGASSPTSNFASFGASVVAACPALAVTKTADATAVTSGNPIGFTIGITNGGNNTLGVATAQGVTLSDTLPPTAATWSIASDSSNSCFISSSSVGNIIVSLLSCPIGDMAPGASVTVHVTSSPTVCGQFSNTAIVTPTNASAISSPQASATILCNGLNVVTTADTPVISAGDTAGLTTTVSLPNAVGPAAADVTLSQPLPGSNGINWQIDPLSPAAADCTISGGPGQTLACAFGSLALGSSETVHVISATTSAGCQNYLTAATASASNYSSANSNASLLVECPALTLSKLADAASVNAGATIGFTLTMANSGQSGTGVAHSPLLTDTLPAGTGINWGINPPNASCSITGTPQVLSCPVTTLNPGGSFSAHVQSSTGASACGSYTNSATLSASNAPEADSSTSTQVLCPALQVSKTADNGTVSAGDQAGYTISVLNSAAAGTGAATGLTVSDSLPVNSGLSWTVDSGPPGCSINGGVLSCSISTLAAGASATVHVISGTDRTTCGTVSNSAVIAAANSLVIAPSSTAAIAVNCPALSLANLADAASVNAGAPIGYTLTAMNTGAGIARNVALAETLPGAGGLNWIIAPAYTMPGTCAINGLAGAQVLSCAFGDLATGASAMVHITSATGGGACGAESPSAALSADNSATLTQGATATVLCPQLQFGVDPPMKAVSQACRI